MSAGGEGMGTISGEEKCKRYSPEEGGRNSKGAGRVYDPTIFTETHRDPIRAAGKGAAVRTILPMAPVRVLVSRSDRFVTTVLRKCLSQKRKAESGKRTQKAVFFGFPLFVATAQIGFPSPTSWKAVVYFCAVPN